MINNTIKCFCSKEITGLQAGRHSANLMKSSTEMESSHVYKAQVCMCSRSVINSILYVRAPQGCTWVERTPSPTVEEKNYTRLKSQKDLFLFLAQTKRFGSGSS